MYVFVCSFLTEEAKEYGWIQKELCFRLERVWQDFFLVETQLEAGLMISFSFCVLLTWSLSRN